MFYVISDDFFTISKNIHAPSSQYVVCGTSTLVV